jgi:hypothetical protein
MKSVVHEELDRASISAAVSLSAALQVDIAADQHVARAGFGQRRRLRVPAGGGRLPHGAPFGGWGIIGYVFPPKTYRKKRPQRAPRAGVVSPLGGGSAGAFYFGGRPRLAKVRPRASAVFRNKPALFKASTFSGPGGIDRAASSASSASSCKS